MSDLVQAEAPFMTRKVQVEAGSDNIFADLGLFDAETHLLKAQIVSEIYRLTRQRKLTQAQAGKRMAISQPESRACSEAIFENTRSIVSWNS
jgi:predicted XRE-type DNA-binding protein